LTEPASTPTPTPTPSEPLVYLALVLSAAAAILLVSGIVYGFATVGATSAGATARFQAVAQAASPFVAALTLATCALLVHERRAGPVAGGQAYAPVALGLAAAVAVATVLLGLTALLLDFDRPGPASFKLGAAISRLATILLAAHAVWLAATAPPAGD
jgi:hypothetical protein